MRFRETWGISGSTGYNDIADADIRRAGISIGGGLQRRRESKRNAFSCSFSLSLSLSLSLALSLSPERSSSDVPRSLILMDLATRSAINLAEIKRGILTPRVIVDLGGCSS